ncbi:MAG: RNA 2',3'-cyclic phosphodiesterase [Roseiflexus sp.]|nr:RNA 2',3'-cyclic phosphodiesterase [Roseiflexus sp.]
MNMATYRLFIAVELPDTLREELASLQTRLKRDQPPVRWVKPEAMHLTLWFLGDVRDNQIADLKTTLMLSFAGQHAAHIRLGAPGAFPNLQQPQVIWVGLAEGEAHLRSWYDALARRLPDLGFPADPRPFRPHLTLGRVRREASAEQQQRLGAALRSLKLSSDHMWNLQRVVLFRSDLRPEGPRYTALAEVDLQGLEAARG